VVSSGQTSEVKRFKLTEAGQGARRSPMTAGWLHRPRGGRSADSR
jgi:hypothetical protein